VPYYEKKIGFIRLWEGKSLSIHANITKHHEKWNIAQDNIGKKGHEMQ